MLRRLARPVFFLRVLAIVFGLGRFHATREGYDFTNSARFAWEITYAVLLFVASYGAGLPDLPRTRRQRLTSAIAAPIAGALSISAVQLVTGDALLPRLVVFGTVFFMVPWALMCTAMARGGRLRAEMRDRVILVAEAAEAVALRDELDGEPERPAVLLNQLVPGRAVSQGTTSKPLTELVVNAG